jgi:hypothetical protein
MKRTHILILCYWFIGFSAWCQTANEKLLFSFSTEKSKTLALTLDTVANVMIYRYGKTHPPELEIRDDLNDTITVFTYSFYLRPGGKENAGLDLNNVTFTNGEFKYVIYSDYSAEIESTSVGVVIHHQGNGTRYHIEGNSNSVKGSLIAPFRWDELIPTVEMDE